MKAERYSSWVQCDNLVQNPLLLKQEHDKSSLLVQIATSVSSCTIVDPKNFVEFYSITNNINPTVVDTPENVYVIYDGSFAPVHIGHVTAVSHALHYINNYYQQKGFTSRKYILQICCVHGTNLRKKLGRKIASTSAIEAHRYNMLKLAFNSKYIPFNVEFIFFEEATCFTFKTNCLQTISLAISMANYDAQRVWFVVGDDALGRLRHQICSGVNVVVSLRTGATGIPPAMSSKFPKHLLHPPHLHLIETLEGYSSTKIRDYLINKENEVIFDELNELIQIPEVTTYLINNKLFRKYPKIIGIAGISGCGKSTLSKNFFCC